MKYFLGLFSITVILAFIISCERNQNIVKDLPKENISSDNSNKIAVDSNGNSFIQKSESNVANSSKTEIVDYVGIESLKKQISGTWIKDGETECYCGQCLEIQFKKQIDDFCVESNQIFVSGSYLLDRKNKQVKFFFKDPTDLGVGGGRLPWRKFNRKKPIAIIDISKLSKNSIKVKWVGFSLTRKTTKGKFNYGRWYQGTYHKN
jgi:hypothetical protein